MWTNLGWAAFFVWHWIRSGDEWFFACAMAAVGLAIMAKVIAFVFAPVPKQPDRPYPFGNHPLS